MTFRTRMLVSLLAVGVAPALLVAWTAYDVNRAELIRSLGAAQAGTAEDAARQCETFVLNAVEHLKAAAGYLPLARLPPADVPDMLRIPLRQLPAMDALALLAEGGTAIAPPVYDPGEGGEGATGTSGREAFGPRELDAFARGVPLATALAADVAIGAPYPGPRPGSPRVAVAVRVPGPPRLVLAAELSLRQPLARLAEIADADGVAYVVDGRAQVLAAAGWRGELSTEERQLVDAAARAPQPTVRTVMRGDGARWLAAYAPVGTLGWGVVVARREAVALRAATRARAFTLFWAGAALLGAVLIGTLLARSVARPVARLSSAARALTEGRYDVPVAVERRDELGELATAFDHMAREVRRRDDEIRSWNADLVRRVDEKTAELRAAQDQIARARRLAALGSLGAGVAHEINNPMTAIIGLVSVVRKTVGPETRNGELLGTILEQARRVAQIVDELRQLTDHQRSGPGVRFPLAAAVQAALVIHAPDVERTGVTVRADLDADVPQILGDPAQIQQLVGHLLQNAIAATPERGEVRLCVSAVDGEAVKLTIADNGRGIPPEMRERIFDPFFARKEHGSGVGLGLTLSNCIVESHHGKLLVDSEEGKGSTFTVLLPAASKPHLE